MVITRKLITIMLLVLVSMSLTACGSAQPGTFENPSPKQATQSAIFSESTTIKTDKGQYTNITPESSKDYDG